MFTQHFIIEGRYLGQTTRDTWLEPKLGLCRPASFGFYCGACGDTFAKAPVEGATGPAEWFYYRLGCRKCKSTYQSLVPGSIYLSWDPEFTAAFPQAVLQWEFDRHWEHFERTRNES